MIKTKNAIFPINAQNCSPPCGYQLLLYILPGKFKNSGNTMLKECNRSYSRNGASVTLPHPFQKVYGISSKNQWTKVLSGISRFTVIILISSGGIVLSSRSNDRYSNEFLGTISDL